MTTSLVPRCWHFIALRTLPKVFIYNCHPYRTCKSSRLTPFVLLWILSVVALYLHQGWWCVHDVLKTSNKTRSGLLLVNMSLHTILCTFLSLFFQLDKFIVILGKTSTACYSGTSSSGKNKKFLKCVGLQRLVGSRLASLTWTVCGAFGWFPLCSQTSKTLWRLAVRCSTCLSCRRVAQTCLDE